jgi:hypothetical protein
MDWNIPFYKQPGNGISREIVVDTLHVKMLRRAYQKPETDTWDYYVKNGYYLGKEVLINTLSINAYRESIDGRRDYHLPNSSMTYNEYLRLGVMNSRLLPDWVPNIEKSDYILNLPFLDPSIGLVTNSKEPIKIEFIFQKKQNQRENNKLIKNFIQAEKLEPDKKPKDTILAGKFFARAQSNLKIRYYDEMTNKKWKFKYNSQIDYRDIIILRAMTFFNDRTNKKNYLKCEQEIQRLIPDFEVDENTRLGKAQLKRALIGLKEKSYD